MERERPDRGGDPSGDGGDDGPGTGPDGDRLHVVLNAVAVGLGALGHALLTWPLDATLALFGGGAVVAFVAEAVVVRRGWLVHHRGVQVIGVPLYALFGWTGTVYVALRVALLVADGPVAIGLAALLATVADGLVDHRGVAAGHWTYRGGPPGPRLRGVPWWNAAGWLTVSAIVAALTLPAL